MWKVFHNSVNNIHYASVSITPLKIPQDRRRQKIIDFVIKEKKFSFGLNWKKQSNRGEGDKIIHMQHSIRTQIMSAPSFRFNSVSDVKEWNVNFKIGDYFEHGTDYYVVEPDHVDSIKSVFDNSDELYIFGKRLFYVLHDRRVSDDQIQGEKKSKARKELAAYNDDIILYGYQALVYLNFKCKTEDGDIYEDLYDICMHAFRTYIQDKKYKENAFKNILILMDFNEEAELRIIEKNRLKSYYELFEEYIRLRIQAEEDLSEYIYKEYKKFYSPESLFTHLKEWITDADESNYKKTDNEWDVDKIYKDLLIAKTRNKRGSLPNVEGMLSLSHSITHDASSQ